MNLNSNVETPVDRTQRLVSIDVLRGFALLGILMVNIQSFGLIGAKYLNPMAIGPLEGSSYWSWWMTYTFFDSKFMTIFSLLFGAGIVLMWERARKSGRKFTGLHYRRTFWLLLFGLAHAHLLWSGDILFLYGICGMVVYWLCGLKAHWLIPIGMVLLTIGSLLSLFTAASLPYMEPSDKAEMASDWTPTEAQAESEIAAFRGSWFEQNEYRTPAAIFMETFLVGFWGFWRAGGLMLVGMGLFKLGVFNAQRSAAFYSVGAAVGLLVGMATIQYGVYQLGQHEWSFEYSFFTGNQFNYWGSLPMSFGYICLVMLVCQKEFFPWVRRSLAAVGQMALTNYLLQTIICTTIFYGHGFGQFERLSRLELVVVVLAIWLCQMIASPIWLKHFRFGPFEWLWRSLAYWKVQKLAR